MFYLKRLALAALIIALAVPAQGDHPTVGFGSGLTGPITTVPATTLPKNTWAVGFRSEISTFDRFADERLETFARDGEDVHSVDELFTLFLGAAFGLTDDLTVSARVPFVQRTNIREGELEGTLAEVNNDGDASGIGDITVFGQYRLLAGNARNRFAVVLLGGLSVPVGQDNVDSGEGEVFGAQHQPSSGSWDPLLGVALSRPVGQVAVDGNVVYRLATEGSQDTDLGDLLNYNLAGSYRVIDRANSAHDAAGTHDHNAHAHFGVDLVLELNGEWRDRETHLGETEESSGGSLVLLAPGARVSFPNDWSVSFSVGFPVAQDLNGDQHETDARFVAGFAVGF